MSKTTLDWYFAWQSQPVFVSSTFRDMQAERDHLQVYVFPELEERLRGRRRNLAWVDLRLGVAVASYGDDQVREQEVLRHCLTEIKRCKPFLIVLLGDRYGWVPPAERIAEPAREEGFKGNLSGLSATALEIRFGILDDPDLKPRCLFYFREPLPYDSMPPDVAAIYTDARDNDPAASERSKRLAALKQEIVSRLPDRVHRYQVGWDSKSQKVIGLEAWGKAVVEDIWSEITAEIDSVEVEQAVTWQQAERNALEEYIEDRARDFVGREATLTRLKNLACAISENDPPWGACVTGESGSGKSALFGKLYREIKAAGGFVLAHSTGAGPQAASLESMLRRWIEEVSAAIHLDDGFASSADRETLEAAFAERLSRLASERAVVILIDGLDQFEKGSSRSASWFPHKWPKRVRFIVTTTPGVTSKAIIERAGVQHIQLPPLEEAEAHGIIKGICDRYHRELEPEVIDAMLAKTDGNRFAWCIPLWLVLAVEELNLINSDDFARLDRNYAGSPAERLRSLMIDVVSSLPTDILGLYARTFDRAQNLFGRRFTNAFLGAVALSRGGWRESDFQKFLPRMSGESWNELRFAQLRRLFRGQIRRRGALGQWDFRHGQMRAAARRRLASQGVLEPDIHTFITDHLISLPKDDPLQDSETRVHMISSSWGETALPGDRIALAVLDSLQTSSEFPDVLKGLGNLERAINPIELEKSVARYRSFIETHFSNHEVRPALEEQIGDIHLANSRPDLALISYRSALAIRERLATSNSKTAGPSQRLSALQSKVADSLCDAAASLLKTPGSLDAALVHCREALEIRQHMAASEATNLYFQVKLGVSHDILGNILHAKGDEGNALREFEISREVLSRVVAAEPGMPPFQRALSMTYKNIGEVLRAQGEIEKALQNYRAGLVISERLVAADPGSTGLQSDLAAIHALIGEMLRSLGDFEAALVSYSACLIISESLAKSEPGNREWQRKLSWLNDVTNTTDMMHKACSANFAMLCQYAEANLLRARPGQMLQIGLPGGWSDSIERKFRLWCTQRNCTVVQIHPDKSFAFVQKSK